MNNTSAPKPPRELFSTIYSFAPNSDTLSGTAYLILEKSGNTLVDCPPWHENTVNFLKEQGGVRTLFITHRTAIGNHVAKFQKALDCEIVIQEQEAYLMPEAEVISFSDQWHQGNLTAIWTTGFSPGSSCLYYQNEGGCLFTGRHLLPNHKSEVLALRTAKTFHWPRQLKSIDRLVEYFGDQSVSNILPAANIGYLYEFGMVKEAYAQLKKARELSENQPNLDMF